MLTTVWLGNVPSSVYWRVHRHHLPKFSSVSSLGRERYYYTMLHTQGTHSKPNGQLSSPSIPTPAHDSPLLFSHRRRLGKHRQRLRPVSRHHARARCARSHASPQRDGRHNERGRGGSQGQGGSHLELHGCKVGGGYTASNKLLGMRCACPALVC